MYAWKTGLARALCMAVEHVPVPQNALVDETTEWARFEVPEVVRCLAGTVWTKYTPGIGLDGSSCSI